MISLWVSCWDRIFNVHIARMKQCLAEVLLKVYGFMFLTLMSFWALYDFSCASLCHLGISFLRSYKVLYTNIHTRSYKVNALHAKHIA